MHYGRCGKGEYGGSTVISNGCPGIFGSPRTSGLLYQRTNVYEICSKGKMFFKLTFFPLYLWLKKTLTGLFHRMLTFKAFSKCFMLQTVSKEIL